MLFARFLIRVRSSLRATVRIGGLVVLVAALEAGPLPGIVRRAASIPETAQGLEGVVNAANALITPALVAMAAVAPLGCIVGAGATMFRSRPGMVMIGASLGTLISRPRSPTPPATPHETPTAKPTSDATPATA